MFAEDNYYCVPVIYVMLSAFCLRVPS